MPAISDAYVRLFSIGDWVRVRDSSADTRVDSPRQRGVPSHSRLWVIVDEDTNETPVYDPEPAFKLSSLDGRHRRYAYQSTMERAL